MDSVFALTAITSQTDAHLARDAVYLRVLLHPSLGLPTGGVLISRRFVQAASVSGPALVWVTEDGMPLGTAGISLPPGVSATGWIPYGAKALGARVLGSGTNVPTATLASVPGALPRVREAQVMPRLPFTVASPSFVGVQMVGPAQIETTQVLLISQDASFMPWRILRLPIDADAVSYALPAGAMTSEAQVDAVGLERAARWDDPAEELAIDLALRQPADALSRLKAIGAYDRIRQLVADATANRAGSVLPRLSTVKDTTQLGASTLDELMLAAATDLSVAGLLGLATSDPISRDDLGLVDGDIVMYRVDGIWEFDAGRAPPLAAGVPGICGIAFAGAQGSLTRLANAGIKPLATFTNERVAMTADVAVVCGTDPAELSAPYVGLLGTSGWLPTQSGQGVRSVTLSLDDLPGGATLAITRNDQTVALNRATNGYHLPIAPDRQAQRPQWADALAPSAALTYRLATSDLWGRWSPWAQLEVASLANLPPAPPLLSVRHDPSALVNAVGRAASKLLLSVQVPLAESLAVGTQPLADVKVDLSWSGGGVSLTSSPLGAPPWPDKLVLESSGPELDRGEVITAEAVGYWRDADGVLSGPGMPVDVVVADPRSPAPPELTEQSFWTARPTVDGRARATLSWSPVTADLLRIYVVDEHTVVQSTGEDPMPANVASAVSTLAQSIDRVERATAGLVLAAAIPRRRFRLTGSVPGSGTLFVDDLSGDLETFVLYKVVSVSPAGVESEFVSSPAAVRLVPIGRSSPKPTLELLDIGTGAAGQILFQGRVPRRASPAAEYRLRRSGSTARGTHMPITSQGGIPASSGPEQSFVVSEPRSGLRPWSSYSWRLEVRPQPFDAELTSPWSPASESLTLKLVPPTAPVAPKDVKLLPAQGPAGLSFTIDDPDVLAAPEEYRVELWAESSDGPMRLAAWTLASTVLLQAATGAAELTDLQLPTGLLRLRLVDPLSRASAHVDVGS